jgi:threonine/homoserine/homoserine lactone efflux protein
MSQLHYMLLAGLTGLVFGWLLSIPVGPVNLTIINEGAQRGFKWAVLIGLGASAMEVIYCSLAFTGFASFFSEGYVKVIMELGTFVFMLGLGILLLVKKPPSCDPAEGRFERKFHPSSAFMIGFVRVMGNLGVFLFWIVLAGSFTLHEWVRPVLADKVACVTGVALGTSTWFVGLSWAVSLGHRKFSDKTLLRMQKGSGIGLLGLGLIHGAQIVIELVRNHRA